MQRAMAEDEQLTLFEAFGESWDSKKRRIRASSPFGDRKGWDLYGVIVKSNDDLRQEVCALQLIELSRRVFKKAKLPLYLKSYRIVANDATTGFVEVHVSVFRVHLHSQGPNPTGVCIVWFVQVLTNAISIDALKKRQLQLQHTNIHHTHKHIHTYTPPATRPTMKRSQSIAEVSPTHKLSHTNTHASFVSPQDTAPQHAHAHTPQTIAASRSSMTAGGCEVNSCGVFEHQRVVNGLALCVLCVWLCFVLRQQPLQVLARGTVV